MPSTTALLAKQVRKKLAAEFPLHLFQVKTKKDTDGQYLQISWEDGPTSRQIEDVLLEGLPTHTYLEFMRSYSHQNSEPYLSHYGPIAYLQILSKTSFYNPPATNSPPPF